MHLEEFKIGDKVIDILTKEIGVVIDDIQQYKIHGGICDITIAFYNGNVEYCTKFGKFNKKDIKPRILYYRDDYDYSVIDFNNLPCRQNSKRWRAEYNTKYYYIRNDNFIYHTYVLVDLSRHINNLHYAWGNYFQTEEQANKVADKMNTYFQKIVKI